MADGFVGADPDELDRIADQLASDAARLQRTHDTMRAAVATAPWRGPRSERFRKLWTTEYANDLVAANEFLSSAARTLRHNADQQRSTSAVGGNQGAKSLDDAAFDEMMRRVGHEIYLHQKLYQTKLNAGGIVKGVGVDLNADATARLLDTMDPDKPFVLELSLSGEIAAMLAAKKNSDIRVGAKGTVELSRSFATKEERDAYLEELRKRFEDTEKVDWTEKAITFGMFGVAGLVVDEALGNPISKKVSGAREAAEFLYDDRKKMDHFTTTREITGGIGVSASGQEIRLEGSFGIEDKYSPDGDRRESTYFMQAGAKIDVGQMHLNFTGSGGILGSSRLDAEASMRFAVTMDEHNNATSAVIQLSGRGEFGTGPDQLDLRTPVGGIQDTSTSGKYYDMQLHIDLTDPETADLFRQLADPANMTSPSRVGDLLDRIGARADMFVTVGSSQTDTWGANLSGEVAWAGAKMIERDQSVEHVYVKPRGHRDWTEKK